MIDNEHYSPKKLMRLKVTYREVHFGRSTRVADVKWYPNKETWELSYKKAVALGIVT